jgi:hypothetical protein
MMEGKGGTGNVEFNDEAEIVRGEITSSPQPNPFPDNVTKWATSNENSKGTEPSSNERSVAGNDRRMSGRPWMVSRCLAGPGSPTRLDQFHPREARLIAETMDENAECHVIAAVESSSLSCHREFARTRGRLRCKGA